MKVLLICEPLRKDWYTYLGESEILHIDSLWYEAKKDDLTEYDKLNFTFQNIYYWVDFSTPGQLLKKIKPDKILFFEIIDHRQISLIIAANKLNIPTIFIDHGAAGDKDGYVHLLKNAQYFKKQVPYLFKRFKTLSFFIKSKIFYLASVKYLKSFKSIFPFFLLPIRSLFYTNPIKTLNASIFKERVPSKLILFSKANYKQFSLQVGDYESRVSYTGVPFFDKYFLQDANKEQHIVFIDHPYLEEQLVGWNLEHHDKVASALFSFANKFKRKVYVKLHPRSNMNYWRPFMQDYSYLEVLQHGDFTKIYLTSSLIIGYSSSLLTGLLCAQKNIVNVGWHPEPKIFGVNFSETNLCHQSLAISDLQEKFEYWEGHNLSISNERNYIEFLKEYNYPFDGQATKRILDIITTE